MLLALTIGLPLVLLVIAPIPMPQVWPSLSEIWSALMRPDDGSLFLGALRLTSWGAWAWFAISVVVQIVSDVRGLPAPHVPTLGAAQRGAAVLLTGAALLFTSGAPGLAADPNVSTVVATAPLAAAPVSPGVRGVHAGSANGGVSGAATSVRVWSASTPASRTSATESRPAPAQAPDVDPHLQLAVRSGDTLWGLAERHLGRGERFTEIFTLNHGRIQPDGRALTDAGGIYPGWTLHMPTDAHGLPAATPVAQPPDGQWQEVHQVVAGETLWEIAEQRLGDGSRYPEIYDLNVGAPQLDGAALTDPDLIRPGWFFTMPASPTTHPTAIGDPGQPSAPAPAPVPPDERTSPTPEAPLAQKPAAEPPAGLPSKPELAPQEADGQGRDQTSATDVDRDAAQGSPVGGRFSELTVGLTALAAAGFIGEISRRRRRQQRLRRTGQRIAMPNQGSAESDAEQALRGARQPFTIAALKAALHRFGPSCAEAGRDLPRVGALLVSEDLVQLLLTEEDVEVIAPFTSAGDRVWTASTDKLTAQAPRDDLGLYPEPYPALVSVGVSGDAIVLVNLEAAGLLSLNGPDDVVQGSLRAIASELATSVMTGGASLLLAPQFGELAEAAGSMRVHAAPTTAALTTSLERADLDCREVLEGAGSTDALRARSMLAGDDIWNPVVLVGPGLKDPVSAWAGYAVVTTNATEAVWRLDLASDSRARLEPLGIDLRPELLALEDYASLIELLRIGGIDPDPDERPEPVNAATEIADALEAFPPVPDASIESVQRGLGDNPLDPLDVPPRIHVLGPLEVTGTTGGVARDRARRQTELVAFLALYPRVTSQAVDEIIGEGEAIEPGNRNTFVSRTRSWLGTDSHGDPYLPTVRGNGIYQLSAAVTCDWKEFCTLAKAGLAKGTGGAAELREALDLIRGRPFADVRPGTYQWADALIQEMTSSIADVSCALAHLEFEAGNYRAAASAIAIGLLVDPCNEMLFRVAITAAHRRGDHEEVDRLVQSLKERTRQIDPDGDFEQETVDLLISIAEPAEGGQRARLK
ncbi:MAG: LysM peptidoglycan-binding domain-containing protein [Cellulomonas sp.]